MGAFDNLGRFCESQAIAADATASTNTIDLVNVIPQLGVGANAPFLNIRTAVAPTAVSNDTLAIEVQVDSTVAFGSPKVVFMPLIGVALAEVNQSDARLATAGAWIYRGQLPYGINERHMRLVFRNGTSVGVFTIDAWLSGPPDSDRGNEVLVSNVSNP